MSAAVLMVHGMGDPAGTFARKLRHKIERRLRSKAKNVEFVSAYWGRKTQGPQDELWQRMQQHTQGPLTKVLRRDVAISGFGDALAYVGTLAGDAGHRQHIHDSIAAYMKSLRRKVDAGTPLVVVAHSLGAYIMEEYIKAEQARGKLRPGDDAFLRMKTLRGFVSFGCNIPLFRVAEPRSKHRTFRLPRNADWLNFYSKRDILGYPLAASFPRTYGRVKDVAVNTGVLARAHSGYWSNGTVARDTATLIRGLL